MDININTIDEKIGLAIKLIRKSRKITLKKLADVAGVSYQQMQKYENGANRISASRLKIVSDILKTDIRFFYGMQSASTSTHAVIASDLIDKMTDHKQRALCVEVLKTIHKHCADKY